MSNAAEHWHMLYRAECLKRQDDAARLGQKIIDLEYCECGLEPVEDEIATGKCSACGGLLS